MKKLLSPATILVTLSGLLLYAGCSTHAPKVDGKFPWPTKNPDEISVMNFNVENLFDNIHDDKREDQTYLPLKQKQTSEHKNLCAKISQIWAREECLTLDWSDEVVAAKLGNISQVILGVDERGPDILILEEVENDRILSRLNKEFLQKAGYQTQVLIEGFDERGIDVAVLSRFPLEGKPKLHRIPFSGKNEHDQTWMNRSRGILEVTLKLPTGDPVTVFGAHFPSQQNPRYWREQAVHYLAKLVGEKSTTGMVIAGGDLNISHNEEIEAQFFHNTFSNVAQVSHIVGCKKCDGTHNYRKEWSFFDVLMFSKGMTEKGSAAYRLEPSSVDVVHYDPIHLFKEKYPKRFAPENKEGVSDHFPIYARLIKNINIKAN
jgi:endonuclease/exonuclease/phosphatase family metal-dependent hydrolase